MHRKNPISVLVYNNLFPTPSPTDPPSFSAHLSKNLVGEVRIETANFYGSLDTIEARYPGLNYAFAPHRKRLGRFPHHRRLFEAFDRLGLTESEIQGFCRWEGTLWARERYERDEGVKVIDTTGVEIGEWVDRRQQQREGGINGAHGINVKTDIEVEIEEVSNNTLASGSSTTDRGVATTSSSHQHSHSHHHHHAPPQLDTEMTSDDDDEDEDEDPEEEEDETSSQTSSSSHSQQQQQQIHQLSSSIGFSLNARLLHAAALRESGATNVPMDPEWEQYLKDAQERGELAMDASQVQTLRSLAGQIAHIHQSGVDVESSAAAATQQQQQQQQQGYEAPAAPA